MGKQDDWFSLAEIRERYPELISAIANVYNRHPRPGSEALVRVPDIAAGLVRDVANEWSTLNDKPREMFPFHGWVVLFAWVKYRKQPNQRNPSE